MPDTPKVATGTDAVAPSKDGQSKSTVTLPEPCKLVVFVCDWLGTPIRGAKVTVTCNGKTSPGGATDERGRLEVQASTGEVRVTAAMPEPKDASGKTIDSATSTTDEEVALTIATGTTKRVAYVRLDPSYFLTHRFPWQNEHVRKTLYGGGGGKDSAGHAASSITERVGCIRHFIWIFNTMILPEAKRLKPSDSAREHVEDQIKEAEATLAKQKTEEARLKGERTDELKREDAAIAEEVADQKTRSKDPNRDERPTKAEIAALKARSDKAKADKKALEKEIKANQSAQKRTKEEIHRLRTLDDTGKILAEISEPSDHKEAVERLFDVFAADDGKEPLIPLWVRYMVLHFSGFRYNGQSAKQKWGDRRCAHTTYSPPDIICLAAREYEISTDKEIAKLDASVRDELALAYQGLLPLFDPKDQGAKSDPKYELTRAVLSDLKNGDALLKTLHSSDEEARARIGVIEPIALSLATAWRKTMTDDQALGTLYSRFERGEFKDCPRVWKKIVTQTVLRNDTKDPDWEVFDDEEGKFPEKWNTALRKPKSDAWHWKKKQGADLTIAPRQAVCNEIAEMGAYTRGLTWRELPGGIGADASCCVTFPGRSYKLAHIRDNKELAELKPGMFMFVQTWGGFDDKGAAADYSNWAHEIVTSRHIESTEDFIDPKSGFPLHISALPVIASAEAALDSHRRSGYPEGPFRTPCWSDGPTPVYQILRIGVAPDGARYIERIKWLHIATVIAVLPSRSTVITFETQDPTRATIRANLFKAPYDYFGQPPSPLDRASAKSAIEKEAKPLYEQKVAGRNFPRVTSRTSESEKHLYKMLRAELLEEAKREVGPSVRARLQKELDARIRDFLPSERELARKQYSMLMSPDYDD
ncbi:MAG: hypothetical protein U0414_35795 [Polyangiaceae bacterium]